jgi:hypothetical protein
MDSSNLVRCGAIEPAPEKTESIVSVRVIERDLTPYVVGIAVLVAVGAIYVIFSTIGLSQF